MTFVKTLNISPIDHSEKAIDRHRHLSGDERVSLVENIRHEMAKVQNYEYPSRLRRVLTITKR